MLFRGAALSSLQKQLATASSSPSSVSSSSASVAASVTAAAVVLVTASSYGAESSSNEPARTNDGHYSTAPAVGTRGAAFPPSLSSRWRAGGGNGVALCRAANDNGAALKRPDSSAAATTKTATTKGGGGAKRPYGIDVVLGSQWGDEGKGKLVDILSQVSLLNNGVESGVLLFCFD